MRSDRLGYNAPIVVRENKYYEYEDPDFSITHLPLNDEGLDALNSALDILRQLQGFPQLASSIDIISKLNEHIARRIGASRLNYGYGEHSGVSGVAGSSETFTMR